MASQAHLATNLELRLTQLAIGVGIYFDIWIDVVAGNNECTWRDGASVCTYVRARVDSGCERIGPTTLSVGKDEGKRVVARRQGCLHPVKCPSAIGTGNVVHGIANVIYVQHS